MLRILQANMHRCKVAHDLLSQIVAEQRADIVIISEQYGRRDQGSWLEDPTKTAAIWIPYRNGISPVKSGSGDGYVWVQLNHFTLFSCYLTPSDSIDAYEAKLDEIEDTMRGLDGHHVVAGDFNSRAVEWGMPTTNPRGRRVLDMAARTGLLVVNTGDVPTFRRPGCEGTIPDITLASEEIIGKITEWSVLETYTASDHQYIMFSFNTGGNTVNEERSTSTRKWNVSKLDSSKLLAEIDRQAVWSELDELDVPSTVERVMEIIEYGCKKSMPKLKRPRGNKTAVHWWNDAIAEQRSNCIKLRRRYTRARRRGTAETEHALYKEAKKILAAEIERSKKEKWEELREDINRNPWGLGYKIVMEKLGTRSPTAVMDGRTMENIVHTLFPRHDRIEDEVNEEPTENINPFTKEELKNAARSLQSRKAPGPDGIPSEVIRLIAENRPEFLLEMFNRCLMAGVFPEVWKRQKLVLISKGKGDPISPSTYRPLCMLDTAGKLLERLLKPRLQDAIIEGGGLSMRQHGFRAGMSTIGALRDVVEIVEVARQRNHYSRPIVLLATLDVKNAFNSLRWSDVLKSLREDFNIPAYLMRIMRSYLSDRVLIYNSQDGTSEYEVTSGAAQGSILGPDLWNASYDGILRMEMPDGTFLVGYADDIAAVITARDTEGAERKLRQVMLRARDWLDSHGLQLAMQKTELLLLTRKNIPVEVDMRIDDILVKTKRSIKYLGIRLDTKLTYAEQIRHATTKASKITAQLSRLMANIGGPLPSRRRLLMETCNSILLYGSEIWGQTLQTAYRAKSLLSVQRTAALRVISSYRTVSEPAALVIAGMVPIDLQAMQRARLYTERSNTQRIQDGAQMDHTQAIREETTERWQQRWTSENRARWTRRLIPDVRIWKERKHGDVNYYVTQMLTGHGYFRKYLHKMGKCSSSKCIYEEVEVEDDVEHTFFHCERWVERRSELEAAIGDVTPETIVQKMLEDERKWEAVKRYAEQVLRRKKADLDAAA